MHPCHLLAGFANSANRKSCLWNILRLKRISKTYLWELEKDTAGVKKPSADVLLRIATALSTTIADLMSLPSVRVQQDQVQIPPSLGEFQKRMETMGTPLSPEDLQDLAGMKFRGGQPQTADEWHSLYLVLTNSTRRPRS